MRNIQGPTSPKAQLRSLLAANDVPESSLDAAVASSVSVLTAADAENKLHHRKLYLVRKPRQSTFCTHSPSTRTLSSAPAAN